MVVAEAVVVVYVQEVLEVLLRGVAAAVSVTNLPRVQELSLAVVVVVDKG